MFRSLSSFLIGEFLSILGWFSQIQQFQIITENRFRKLIYKNLKKNFIHSQIEKVKNTKFYMPN